jgi:GNAT superfamily N-acetyltransferase
MISIRPCELKDTDSLYAICLATGDGGQDAKHLYTDGRMLGHIYAAPYAALTPVTCFVAEMEGNVVGFVVGTLDTIVFETMLETAWWPALRTLYPNPPPETAKNWSADERQCALIHNPTKSPLALVAQYPAHLHMNLLPEAQGQGVGTSLLKTWLSKAAELGATSVHIGASPKNLKAIGFWQTQGFTSLDHLIPDTSSPTGMFGRKINQTSSTN